MSHRRTAHLLAWCIRLLHERTIMVLGVMFLLTTLAMLWHLDHVQARLVHSQGLRDAARRTQSLTAFRTLYTSEVVTAVMDQGIEVVHDYKNRAGAIPLPATLSMLIGNRLAEQGAGGRTRLYSPYPFPWRRKEGGLRDGFAREAWDTLLRNPDEPFYRFEDYDGRHTLRYATADVMRASCVNCHNSHPDTPKNDWKVGDVRGILEVVTPLDPAIAQSRAELRGTFAMMVGIPLVALSGLAVVIRKLRRTSAELEERVANRTAKLRATNGALEREVADRKQAETTLRTAKQRADDNAQSAEHALAAMERMNAIMMGREVRVLEMKKEVNDLLGEAGRTSRYEHV